MGKVLEGKLVVAKGTKFALVAGRFNEFITAKLVEGARDALLRHGAAEDDITLVWVPGSFEMPVVAKRLAEGCDASDADLSIVDAQRSQQEPLLPEETDEVIPVHTHPGADLEALFARLGD